MISKKFYSQIILRIILIVINSLSIAPFFTYSEKLFTILALIILLIVQIYALINYINKFNSQVASFFSALKTNDSSFAFHDKAFPYIDNTLRNDIEHVRNQIFSITQQKDMHESYLKTMIENARTGIISVSTIGKVDIINRYAQDLLNISKITDISVLEDLHPELYHFIKRCNAGDEKMILIKGHSKTVPIAIKTSEFKQKSDHYKLISFQNIESELNEKEMLSWHKLMRVLTHEINNSISPIVSLSKSLEKLYVNDTDMAIDRKDISDKTIAKSLEGIQLISKRGEGLIKFVNNYKSITSLKQIDPEKFKVAELFYNLELLLKPELDRKHIDLQIDIKPFDLELTADKKYMEQVCINLLKNSIESINNQHGKIKLSALRKNDKTVLNIEDNGKGIPQELMDQVFVPFFTTKEQGSGIGLSLAQQIMRLHGGKISVNSVEHKGTSFTLTF